MTKHSTQQASEVVVFLQPFPLGVAGGGPRIMRMLLRDPPVPILPICTSPLAPGQNGELHLPIRPYLGRIEHTRFHKVVYALAPLFRRWFVTRLEKLCRGSRAQAIHCVAHGGLDFYDAWGISRKLQIPYFLQVHDDVEYTSGGHVSSRFITEAWQGAAERFVVSQEMGTEYCKRYGAREFVIVTDGLEQIAPSAVPGIEQLRIYFMGLFHLGYEQNLEALIRSLELLPAELKSVHPPSITLRCGSVRSSLLRPGAEVRVLPFGSEADVQADLAGADCLYLPLHFDESDRPFAAYSLSTKMVTYLGSGIPILYHGPTGTAAYRLLRENRAAALATSLDPAEIARVLSDLLRPGFAHELAENALLLARRAFLRSEQHGKFWQRLLAHL